MMKFSDRIQLMALKWDSTKEPHKTERFIDDVIHLINQLEGGEWLVFFLDHYLCRAKKNETYPTFMGGGIFDLNPPPIPLVAADPVEGEEEEEEEVEEAQPLAHSADTVGGSAVPSSTTSRSLEAPYHPPLQVQKSVLEKCHPSSSQGCGPRRHKTWTGSFTPRY